MARGITITNYLANGDPEGVIFSYMSNWSGQAIKIPRNLFAESKALTELQRPGLYLLIGPNPENPDDKQIYIGEANKLSERIGQHLRDSDKAFTETIVCFCSKDENLTVSHTKYLEQKSISQLSRSTEYRMINRKDGNIISLPKMVQDEMDAFFDNMKIILPTLGYSILHTDNKVKIGTAQTKTDTFNLEIGGRHATAHLTSTGIEVLKGSEMSRELANSITTSYVNLRKTLVEKEIVQEVGGKLIFTQDYEFSSPSTAAAILLGYAVNGRTAWKNSKGQSIKELEDAQIATG